MLRRRAVSDNGNASPLGEPSRNTPASAGVAAAVAGPSSTVAAASDGNDQNVGITSSDKSLESAHAFEAVSSSTHDSQQHGQTAQQASGTLLQRPKLPDSTAASGALSEAAEAALREAAAAGLDVLAYALQHPKNDPVVQVALQQSTQLLPCCSRMLGSIA